MVCVAQLVRVAGCDSVGRGFESHLIPHKNTCLRGGMVDTIDSKSIASRHVSSSLTGGTIAFLIDFFILYYRLKL